VVFGRGCVRATTADGPGNGNPNAFVARAWRPHTAVLVRVDGRKGYHDHARHPQGRNIPGLVMVRFDAPLSFANGSEFEETIRAAVDAAPGQVRWVILAADPMTDVDTTGRRRS
jgi:MFS superfamily sulfate permease-like transporter